MLALNTSPRFLLRKVVVVLFILNLFIFGVSCDDDEPQENAKLSISGFSPQEGGEDDLVVISGKNFADRDHLQVKFGDYFGYVESATRDALLVRLPPYLHTCDEVAITVFSDTTKLTSEENFKLACPIIESFTPSSGNIGDIITINGAYFTAEPSRIQVSIGTGHTEVIASSSSVINVKLLGEYSGSYPVKVQIGSKVGMSTATFTIKGPAITGFSPSTATACETITITGSDFSSITNENKVYFGYKEGLVISANSTQLVVAPPYDIKDIADKPLTIIVVVNGKRALAANSITLSASAWTKVASLPNIGRWRGVGFSIGQKGYAGTGSVIVNGFAELRKDFWEYNLSTNSWTKKADLPGVARLDAVGFSIGGKGYVGLGGDYQNVLFNDFWEFDPANNSWQQMPDFPGGKRAGAIAFSIGAKGYVGVGWGTGSTYDIWKFDPENKVWTKETEYPGIGTTGMVCFVIGNKAFIGSGLLTNDFWEYTPETKQWRQVSNIPESFIHYGVSFAFQNFGVAGMGASNDGRTDRLWKYDPTKDQWFRLPNFAGAVRNNAIGFSLDNTFLIGTGSTSYNYDLVNDFYKYACQ